MKRLIILAALCFLPIASTAAVRCKIDVPYYGMFNAVVPPDFYSFDKIIYYNNSTCPFTLPPYDLNIQFAHVDTWRGLYFNSWEADYSVIGGAGNVINFDFYQIRPSLVNPACTIYAVSTDGRIVFLLTHYWIEGNMKVEIGHPTDVSVCAAVF